MKRLQCTAPVLVPALLVWSLSIFCQRWPIHFDRPLTVFDVVLLFLGSLRFCDGILWTVERFLSPKRKEGKP